MKKDETNQSQHDGSFGEGKIKFQTDNRHANLHPTNREQFKILPTENN